MFIRHVNHFSLHISLKIVAVAINRELKQPSDCLQRHGLETVAGQLAFLIFIPFRTEQQLSPINGNCVLR